MKQALSAAAVVLGIVLIAVSLVWGILFPASSGWTQDKSVRLRDLRQQAHLLGGQVDAARIRPNMQGGKNPAELEEEYNKVTAELAQLAAEAEGEIEAPKTAARFLRWAGFAFVIAGGLVVIAGRSG
jgi:hypothetical protein